MNERFANLMRLFSWSQLLGMKLAGQLRAWVDRASVRHVLALREFTWMVSPAQVKFSQGLFSFLFPVEGVERTFVLRRDTSDIEVFLQVIRDEEYREVIRMMAPRDHAPRIVDAGANIGLTTVFFKSVFPKARILALEPEAENFKSLQRTLAVNDLDGVVPLQQALWKDDTYLTPNRGFRDGAAWSFALEAGDGLGDDRIWATTLRTLLDKQSWERVDLLKIDIEGAEAGLVRDADTLALIAERVGLLCIEVHPEAISREEVRQALASVGLQTATSGETLVGWRAVG